MMKKMILLIIGLIYLTGINGQTLPSVDQRLEEWKDKRFGMFICWCTACLRGTEMGWSRGREIPVEEYDNLYKEFNPVKYDPEEWVKTAKAAGMKYIVFTSKHHDGFCMWDTKYTDYDIMSTPFKRDIIKELSDACKKHGMPLGIYHSTCDWYHPDFPLTSPGGTVKRETSNLDRYTEYLKNQSIELIQKYGPLLVMWYDVPQMFDAQRGQGVIDAIRKVQPDIIVNNRTGAKGDFDTPEQRIGGFQNDRPWETCMTIARQWSWKPDDETKTLEQCMHSLIRASGGDGNFLFSVGPMADGLIEPLQVDRLKEMGEWLREYGYTIYETRGGPFKPTDWGVSTRKGNKIYLHILKWSGGSPRIVLPDVGIEIKECTLPGGGKVKLSKVKGENILEFDGKHLQPINTIIEIEYEGNVMNVKPVDIPSQSISYLKNVNGSSNIKPLWIDHMWVDLKSINNGEWSGSYWRPSGDDKQPWIEIDLGEKGKISKALLYEEGQNIKAYELQYKSGDKWNTFYKGKSVGPKAEISFKPLEAQVIRMVITSFDGTPGIYEIMLLTD